MRPPASTNSLTEVTKSLPLLRRAVPPEAPRRSEPLKITDITTDDRIALARVHPHLGWPAVKRQGGQPHETGPGDDAPAVHWLRPHDVHSAARRSLLQPAVSGPQPGRPHSWSRARLLRWSGADGPDREVLPA